MSALLAGPPEWAPLLAQARDLIMPQMILTAFACLALVLDVVLPKARHRWVAYASIGGTVLAALSLVSIYSVNRYALPRFGFYGMLVVDEFSLVLGGSFLLALGLSIAIAIRYLDVEGEQHGEFYALMMFATVGMMFMASGYDLLTLYISLELMALSIYVLVGYTKRRGASNEAAMKYFLLGAFSSGILLYGMSLIYGATGSTNLGAIADALQKLLAPGTASSGDLRYLLVFATIFLAAGMLFKVAAVPFHMWAPDAYEGAPTPVTAFMSVGVKAASFAMFARLFLEGLPALRTIGSGEAALPGWWAMLSVVSAITMTWGNAAAVTTKNAKRLLAYSSISHAGYLLLGLLAGNRLGYTGLVIYLIVYLAMNLGVFAVLIALRRGGIEGDRVEDFDGLARREPALAAMMTIFLLSLGGIPPTAGFVGKFYLFAALFRDGDPWMARLALVAVLNTAVSAYYYLRFVKAMYLAEPDEQAPAYETPGALWAAVVIAAVLTVGVGVYPQPVIALSEAAVARLERASRPKREVAPGNAIPLGGDPAEAPARRQGGRR